MMSEPKNEDRLLDTPTLFVVLEPEIVPFILVPAGFLSVALVPDIITVQIPVDVPKLTDEPI